jgi:hypothetical protein
MGRSSSASADGRSWGESAPSRCSTSRTRGLTLGAPVLRGRRRARIPLWTFRSTTSCSTASVAIEPVRHTRTWCQADDTTVPTNDRGGHEPFNPDVADPQFNLLRGAPRAAGFQTVLVDRIPGKLGQQPSGARASQACSSVTTRCRPVLPYLQPGAGPARHNASAFGLRRRAATFVDDRGQKCDPPPLGSCTKKARP